MFKFFKQKNKKRGFTQIVDFKEATPSRTKNASLKLTTGFTLVEVLVALFIFSLTVTAMMAVFASGLSSINVAKKKMAAEYLAQEGIEIVINIRDTYALAETNAGDGWTSFVAKFNECKMNDCSFDNTNIPNPTTDVEFTPCDGDNGTCLLVSGFRRSVRVEGEDETGEKKVFSTVSWTQGTGTQSVTFSDNLFNWIETE